MIEAKIKGFTKYDNYRTKNPTWWQCINSGLHSFAAINELSYFEDKNDLVICSAVIPKGAEYYEGFTEMYSTSSYEDDVTTRKAFVSNKLIVVDKYMNENT